MNFTALFIRRPVAKNSASRPVRAKPIQNSASGSARRNSGERRSTGMKS